MIYDTEKYKATLYNQLKQKINIVQKQITKHSKKKYSREQYNAIRYSISQ